MKRVLINASDAEEIRIAFIDGHTLYDLDIENTGQQQKVNNIYKSKVYKKQKDSSGIFVEYGAERHGFLSLKKVPQGQLISAGGEPLKIDDVKEGQEIMTQVVKDERRDKGAQLSAIIKVPSRYLSVFPNNLNPRDPIPDRLLADAQAVKDALEIPQGIGVSITKEGLEVDPKVLRDELKWLLDVWRQIKEAGNSVEFPAPYPLHISERSPIRVLRDYLRTPVDEIVVDEEEVFKNVREYVENYLPDHAGKVILHEQNWPIFSYYKINDEIQKAFDRTVRLPSGGTIVIDPTEALVAIDVNTAQARGNNPKDTALNTNLEAVSEIARQLRIRDLSGLIVVDLIGMSQKEDQEDAEKIYNKLRQALRRDRATTRIAEVSKFGLIEIERQRLRLSLQETMAAPCPLCQGQSNVLNANNQALRILRQIIEERALSEKVSKIEASTSPAVAAFLFNEKRNAIRKIELERSVQIIINPDNSLLDSQFEIQEFADTDAKIRTLTDQTSLTKSRQQKRRPGTHQQQKAAVPLSARAKKKQGIGTLIKSLFSISSGEKKKPTRSSAKSKLHGTSQSPKPSTPRRPGRGRRGNQNRATNNNNLPQKHSRPNVAKSDSDNKKENEQPIRKRSKPSRPQARTKMPSVTSTKTEAPARNDPRYEKSSPAKHSPVQSQAAPAEPIRKVQPPVKPVVVPAIDKTKIVARNDPRQSESS